MANMVFNVTGGWALVQNGILPNPFYTPGVQNIENRYSALGGAKNHQPAVATKKADSQDVTGRQETQKGMGTPYHQEKYGEQRSDVSQLFLTNKAVVWPASIPIYIEKIDKCTEAHVLNYEDQNEGSMASIIIFETVLTD